MADPLISVVIPTYHRNDLLAQCLECLRPGKQTLLPGQYEVIVTDDGRKTTAQSMIENEFGWARFLAGPQSGPAANRNNGAKAARGEYVVFTDDDCLPDTDWLSAFVGALSPNIDVYEGRTTCKAGIHSPLQHSPINETGGYLWSCNMMVKKSLFWQQGGFDEKFPYPAMEDVDFRERLRDCGQNFVFVKGAVVEHPPRRLAKATRRGAAWESHVYYYQKRGMRSGKIRFQLIYTILNEKAHLIKKMLLNFDTPQYICSTVLEIIHVVLHLERWLKKYSTDTNSSNDLGRGCIER